jgi:hypothetical protein
MEFHCFHLFFVFHHEKSQNKLKELFNLQLTMMKFEGHQGKNEGLSSMKLNQNEVLNSENALGYSSYLLACAVTVPFGQFLGKESNPTEECPSVSFL